MLQITVSTVKTVLPHLAITNSFKSVKHNRLCSVLLYLTLTFKCLHSSSLQMECLMLKKKVRVKLKKGTYSGSFV